jgi:hypothetical protein
LRHAGVVTERLWRARLRPLHQKEAARAQALQTLLCLINVSASGVALCKTVLAGVL